MRRIVLVMACVGALLVAGSSAALAGPHHGGPGPQGNRGPHGHHGHHHGNFKPGWGYRPYTAGYRYGARYIAPYPVYPVAPYAVAPYPAYGFGPQYGFSYSSPGFSLFLGR